MDKHIIFTNGRSGSNYILSLLNSHPSVVNFGEVLGKWTLSYKLHTRFGLGGKSIREYLDNIYKSPFFFYMAELYSAYSHIKKRKKICFKHRSNISSIGIKEFSLNFKRLDLHDYLTDNNDILVVNLYRENQLKRLVSLEIMKQSGVVFVDKKRKKVGRPKHLKINKCTLDTIHIVEQLTIYQNELNDQISLAKSIPSQRVLNIKFEDLFESEQKKTDYTVKLFKFLKVEPLQIKSSHHKILSNNLPDIIANYDEIHAILRKTRFAHFLDS